MLPGLLLLGVAASCDANQPEGSGPPISNPQPTGEEDPGSPETLVRLATRLRDQERLEPSDAKRLFNGVDLQGPMGPLRIFLASETLRFSGFPAEARVLARRLAESAGQAPDSAPRSALGAAALWRWLNDLWRDPEPDLAEVRAAIRVARPILTSDVSRGLFEWVVFDHFPQLEEDCYRKLAVLAWKHGEKAGDLGLRQAQGFFVDFAGVSRSAELTAEEEDLLDEIEKKGWASRDRLTLIRVDSLAKARRFNDAIALLEKLVDSRDRHDRIRAKLELVRLLNKLQRPDLDRQIELLEEAVQESEDPDLRQEALYLRALVKSRRSLDEFIDDLRSLIEKYQTGLRTDDAWYRLAVFHEQRYRERPADEADLAEADLEEALRCYRRLREFSGENDFQDSAYYRAAMARLTRRRGDDVAVAAALLQEYDSKVPFGAFRIMAEFWRGRAFEELGKNEEARKAFERVVESDRFGYYGIRARMHLTEGAAAATRVWPAPGSLVELARGQRRESLAGVSGDSPYHERVRLALESGIYRELVKHRNALMKEAPGTRVSEMTLKELGGAKFALLASLHALRQDLLAAQNLRRSSDNYLEIVGAATRADDRAFAAFLALTGPSRYRGRDRLEDHPSFLATSYPPVFGDLLEREERRWKVPAELLYAVMCRESLFEATAVSTIGALGLFQFTRPTFQSLDRGDWDWRLLEEAGLESIDDYLTDPKLSLELGARYFSQALIVQWICRIETGRGCIVRGEKRPKFEPPPAETWFTDPPAHDPSIPLLALMEHSESYGNVRDWRAFWSQVGRGNDIEFMIDNAGTLQAQRLSRGVLTDSALARSMGLFQE